MLGGMNTCSDDDDCDCSEDTPLQFVDIEDLRPLGPTSDDEIFPLFSKLSPPKARKPVKFPNTSSGQQLLNLRRMNQERPSSSQVALSSSVSQVPQPPRLVRRDWGVWIIRLMVVVTDVIIFLYFDSTSNDLGDVTSSAAMASASSHGRSPALARQLSHARSMENPEFRMLERLVFDESAASQHSTGSKAGCILAVVFLGGVCLEVLWKEINQKGRQRR